MSVFPFDFEVPAERIAQAPVQPRHQARLLVARRSSGVLEHARVHELPGLLAPGDLLVFNDTRVVPARLLGQRERTGGKWEGLFLKTRPEGAWEIVCQTRGRLAPGEWVVVGSGLRIELLERLPEGRWLARPQTASDWVAALEQHGHTPLPPYIRKGRAEDSDRGCYQTVFARSPGAVAAPTAGLHFTAELLALLEEKGIGRTFVTLHVGLGTFRPIEVEDYGAHVMHAEWGCLSAEAAALICRAKERGGRIVAVGTTSVRVLETAAQAGRIGAWTGETTLFIHPPYAFRAVDALLTNFHLPRSTLLLLTCAFGGVALMRQAYETALREGYRFYSYGDAMLVV